MGRANRMLRFVRIRFPSDVQGAAEVLSRGVNRKDQSTYVRAAFAGSQAKTSFF